MRAHIAGAASLMRPVLDLPAGGLEVCTVSVLRLDRASSTPAAAVYVTWGPRGDCRYVGSVRRLQDATAVRTRVREHLRRRPERRANWAAVTVLPVFTATSLEMLRRCEGWVALALGPIEGTAHPVIDMENPVAGLAM
ncbi:hypothetical protein BS329_18005 [Amycolatopsis coloradensis]|uniref:GIY-YIG domain-containing protein n=1 Tax=Amycolatopsis coloradensis TaxID=76021 RepID=A0A1R0KT51_9PSEU|nr:hypothetical protein BS329_18005 [Amycolatopsis coloradensis]